MFTWLLMDLKRFVSATFLCGCFILLLCIDKGAGKPEIAFLTTNRCLLAGNNLIFDTIPANGCKLMLKVIMPKLNGT